MTLVDKMRAKQGAVQKPAPPKFRLPHGSTFQATYDASREKWTATLTVSPTESYTRREKGGAASPTGSSR